MNLTLTRKSFGSDGIFGELSSDDGSFFALSLERGYLQKKKYKSKIPPGEYVCKRGIHRLSDGVEFETFEVNGIKGHFGILFHPANKWEELDGCIATGAGWGTRSDGGKMICDSRKKFNEFMKLQEGLDEFILKVEAV